MDLFNFSQDQKKPLSEDNLIEIVVNAAHSHWCKAMDTIYVKHIQHTLTEAVECLECLEILDTTDKKPIKEKVGKDSSHTVGRATEDPRIMTPRNLIP